MTTFRTVVRRFLIYGALGWAFEVLFTKAASAYRRAAREVVRAFDKAAQRRKRIAPFRRALLPAASAG